MSATGWVILAIAVGVLAVAAIAALTDTWARDGQRSFATDSAPSTTGRWGRRRRPQCRRERLAHPRGALRRAGDQAAKGARPRGHDSPRTGTMPSASLSTTQSSRREADRVVRNVLDERGYPDDDLETRSAAVSVGHPRVVQRYRHGHDMVHGNGATVSERTENLRKAMVDFRAVFIEMVESAPRSPRADTEVGARRPRERREDPPCPALSGASRAAAIVPVSRGCSSVG